MVKACGYIRAGIGSNATLTASIQAQHDAIWDAARERDYNLARLFIDVGEGREEFNVMMGLVRRFEFSALLVSDISRLTWEPNDAPIFRAELRGFDTQLVIAHDKIRASDVAAKLRENPSS